MRLVSEKCSCLKFGEDQSLAVQEWLKVVGFEPIVVKHGLQDIGSAQHIPPWLVKGLRLARLRFNG